MRCLCQLGQFTLAVWLNGTYHCFLSCAQLSVLNLTRTKIRCAMSCHLQDNGYAADVDIRRGDTKTVLEGYELGDGEVSVPAHCTNKFP